MASFPMSDRAGRDVHQEHEDEQDERRGPRLIVPLFVRRYRKREDLDGKRRHRLVEARRPESIVESGEQERRRFPPPPRQRPPHARDHCPQPPSEGPPPDHPPPRPATPPP